jgi:surface protein
MTGRCALHVLLVIYSVAVIPAAVAQTYRCFEFNETTLLRNAIADYITTAPPKPINATSARNVYGPVIGNWCVDRLVSFQGVFQARSTFNEPLTNWNTSSATNMQQMFQDAYSFNQPLGHFDVSRVTNMNRMFRAAVSFTGVGLESWNVGQLQSMFQLFFRTRVNRDISGWDVRNVNDMQDMFVNDTDFNQNLCAWGPRLNATKLPAFSFKVANTFRFTGCPVQANFSLATNPRGPFCHSCVAQPPTKAPTKVPTKVPTKLPTKAPVTMAPTKVPTKMPTKAPTKAPATKSPTKMPTKMPTKAPTKAPVTKAPTPKPTRNPTKAPTKAPATKVPTPKPTRYPTFPPTRSPTKMPTRAPSMAPATKTPTSMPTMVPTKMPTKAPTKAPVTKAPSRLPTMAPTKMLTKAPTKAPVAMAPTTKVPTKAPSAMQTTQPTTALTDAWFDVNENQNYIGRHECSFVQAGNKFFLMGGREDAKRVDRYDYASNTWSTGAPAPKELNHFQAVEYQGLVWVIAAFNTNNFPNEANEPNVHVYDPAVNKWMVGPQIPPARQRGGAGLAVYNDQFYVVGGNSGGHYGWAYAITGGAVPFLDRYDPRANTWEVLADAPRSRDHFQAIVVESANKLYCIGGRATDYPVVFDNTVAAVDVYDFGTGSWATVSNISLPSPRAGASNVLFRGKILVIGGESNTQTAAFKRVDAFDPVSQTFSAAANLIYARHGTQALVSGPGVIITGGSPTRGGGYQTNMEAYNQFAPVGTASTAGVLSVAGGTVSVLKGQVTNVPIVHSSGNTGVLVQSISLQGADAGLFTLLSPPTTPFLIGQGESRTLFAMYNGNRALSTIVLVLTYSGGTTLTVPLQGVNTNPTPTNPPTKQPTPMPSPLRPTTAPTPVSRFGTTCFPADGNALRTAVGVSGQLSTTFR